MPRSPLLLVVLLVVAPACGGGGTAAPDGPPPVPVTVAFPSTPTRTGFGIDTFPPILDTAPLVGDTLFDLGMRGYYSFDISAIPSGAVVTDAVLTTAQQPVVGDPYADLGGAIIVDHVDLGVALDTADYDAPALSAAFGTLSSSATPGVRTVDVTTETAADVGAGRTTSEYRFAFVVETDSSGDEDSIRLEDAAGAGGTVPTLSVTYTAP